MKLLQQAGVLSWTVAWIPLPSSAFPWLWACPHSLGFLLTSPFSKGNSIKYIVYQDLEFRFFSYYITMSILFPGGEQPV